MMLRLLAVLGAALLGLALLAGCGEEEDVATATATSTAAVVTTPKATPSPGATPGATRTATPTATARATATPAPTLTATPAAGLGKLAFVSDGDIWVLDVDSGQERQLTTDGGNREPRWSPDGRWLAFAKGEAGAIWVMREDGSDASLVAESGRAGFTWAPTDNRLTYATGEGVLWLVDVESGEQEEFSLPDWEISRFAWLPDGNALVLELWERQEVATPSLPSTLHQGLWRVNTDGTGLVELYSAWDQQTLTEVDLGLLSPDGGWLTLWEGFVSASLRADGLPLRIMPASGGEPQEIASATLLRPGFVAWSPQGDRLAIVEGGGRQTWVNKQIVVMQPDGSDRRLLSDASRADLFPAWSPDGQRIAFTSGEGNQFENADENYPRILGTRRIWLANSDGSNRRQLTDDPAYADQFPQWSADGAHILFVRQQAGAMEPGDEEPIPVEIWLMKADGSDQRKVTDGLSGVWFGYYGYVDWSQLLDWHR
jgi:Tol biopolymer transport system component